MVKGEAVDPGPKTGGSDSVEATTTNEGDKGAGASGEMKDLLNEATTLLKSLRPAPALKAIKLSSLDRALLDGGATHCLRTAKSEEEWQRAQEVRVELAEGSVTLRQLPWTRTLLTLNETQTIVPLGVLISLKYEASWEQDWFPGPQWSPVGRDGGRHVPDGDGGTGQGAKDGDRAQHGEGAGTAGIAHWRRERWGSGSCTSTGAPRAIS